MHLLDEKLDALKLT